MIPYSKQYIDNNDIKLVSKVLKSNFITQGPLVEKFENAISKYVGAKYAVAVSLFCWATYCCNGWQIK